MSALARTAAAVGRVTVRRASNAAAPAADAAAARPAPRMPEGVDPAALHPKAHAVADMWRWRMVTGVASVPVFGYFCLQVRRGAVHRACAVGLFGHSLVIRCFGRYQTVCVAVFSLFVRV